MNIFWFRRDLRLDDNKGFYEALKSNSEVLPLFIFDNNILDELPKDDSRVSFIHERLDYINMELQKFGKNYWSSSHNINGKDYPAFDTFLSKVEFIKFEKTPFYK